MDLRIADIRTFLALHHHGTLSNAARALGVTPSQVSRAISRLEQLLRMELVKRGARGATLTEDGRGMLGHLMAVSDNLDQLLNRGPPRPVLTVAAPSSLLHLFLPRIAKAQTKWRFRGLVLPTPQIRSLFTLPLFDIAILDDATLLPPTWESHELGKIRTGLFGSPKLADQLRPFPVAPERLKQIPFVMPIHINNGQWMAPDNDCYCPLPRSERLVGDEVQTTGLALDIAVHTQQLVYGVALAAELHLLTKRLVEIPVKGWNIAPRLWLTCNVERVKSTMLKAMVQELRALLTDTGR